ncbi:MAG: LysR family transcriptional regulator [Hydrogenophaga sp.]|uniref:LysR family transcriptional regulator n=1 Tax=Hydrogenophaga sp. TaxID=1904254 RepID=UPI0040360CBD
MTSPSTSPVLWSESAFSLPMCNLARFDLISVRLAVDCVNGGSLTAAAQGAHLALAAASRRIRELEGAFGEPLFERHAKGLSATEAGRVFARHGMALLQTLDLLRSALADRRSGITRHIRLCASTAAITQFLPTPLAAYGRLRPHVRVDLEEQVSEAVVAALRQGRADVGILVEGPNVDGLQVLPFRRDELVLLLPAHHRLAHDAGPIAFADVLDEDLIGLNTGAAILLKQQQTALGAGKPLRLRMQVRSFDAACHLVASGLGIAVLPQGATEPMVRAMPLRVRPLADPWAQRQMLIACAPREDDADLADFVEHLAAASRNAKTEGAIRKWTV